jgi:hypothetical protein
MEQLTNFLELYYTNSEINALLGGGRGGTVPYTRHFNQAEEFFLKLPVTYTVPHFPIHHDILKKTPDAAYLSGITYVISQIAEAVPDVFAGLTYWFDAEEIHKPLFIRLYEYHGNYFLYMLRVDLAFRHGAHEVIEKGDNDTTAYYRTRHLFLEAQMIPVSEVVKQEERIRGLVINQLISQTWIGERGRGYFIQGIWMDDDLSKFFSRLFVPEGKMIYPYYPYICKYKTICRNIISLAPGSRAGGLETFFNAIDFLRPHLADIQNDLRESDFTEELPYFKALKTQVPPELYGDWKDVRIRIYLNEQGMREFIVED